MNDALDISSLSDADLGTAIRDAITSAEACAPGTPLRAVRDAHLAKLRAEVVRRVS